MTTESPKEPVEVRDEPYDENGVDRSLIRWMLTLTPTERLEYLQSTLDLVESVRERER